MDQLEKYVLAFAIFAKGFAFCVCVTSLTIIWLWWIFPITIWIGWTFCLACRQLNELNQE